MLRAPIATCYSTCWCLSFSLIPLTFSLSDVLKLPRTVYCLAWGHGALFTQLICPCLKASATHAGYTEVQSWASQPTQKWICCGVSARMKRFCAFVQVCGCVKERLVVLCKKLQYLLVQLMWGLCVLCTCVVMDHRDDNLIFQCGLPEGNHNCLLSWRLNKTWIVWLVYSLSGGSFPSDLTGRYYQTGLSLQCPPSSPHSPDWPDTA